MWCTQSSFSDTHTHLFIITHDAYSVLPLRVSFAIIPHGFYCLLFYILTLPPFYFRRVIFATIFYIHLLPEQRQPFAISLFAIFIDILFNICSLVLWPHIFSLHTLFVHYFSSILHLLFHHLALLVIHSNHYFWNNLFSMLIFENAK